MGASVAGFLHSTDEIAFLSEINVSFCAQVLCGFFLCGTSVDSDDAEAEKFTVLDSKRAETATSTEKDDVVAFLGVGDFEGFVSGDTAAL